MSRSRARKVETLRVENQYNSGSPTEGKDDLRPDQRHTPKRLIIPAHSCLCLTSPHLAGTLFLQNVAGGDGP